MPERLPVADDLLLQTEGQDTLANEAAGAVKGDYHGRLAVLGVARPCLPINVAGPAEQLARGGTHVSLLRRHILMRLRFKYGADVGGARVQAGTVADEVGEDGQVAVEGRAAIQQGLTRSRAGK